MRQCHLNSLCSAWQLQDCLFTGHWQLVAASLESLIEMVILIGVVKFLRPERERESELVRDRGRVRGREGEGLDVLNHFPDEGPI